MDTNRRPIKVIRANEVESLRLPDQFRRNFVASIREYARLCPVEFERLAKDIIRDAAAKVENE